MMRKRSCTRRPISEIPRVDEVIACCLFKEGQGSPKGLCVEKVSRTVGKVSIDYRITDDYRT